MQFAVISFILSNCSLSDLSLYCNCIYCYIGSHARHLEEGSTPLAPLLVCALDLCATSFYADLGGAVSTFFGQKQLLLVK